MPDLGFAVIGAGMAGVLSAVKLRQAGSPDHGVRKGRPARRHLAENTYPGIA
jgi:cation diffusion facilitator CzcD-associated flavoprotein CzcO